MIAAEKNFAVKMKRPPQATLCCVSLPQCPKVEGSKRLFLSHSDHRVCLTRLLLLLLNPERENVVNTARTEREKKIANADVMPEAMVLRTYR